MIPIDINVSEEKKLIETKSNIIALMAQGDEAVYMLFNKGGIKFETQRVLRFPPDYGTTDMVMTDFNHDGKLDIITAYGDNADYSNIRKAYHGIRIHISNGKNSLMRNFFIVSMGFQKCWLNILIKMEI